MKIFLFSETFRTTRLCSETFFKEIESSSIKKGADEIIVKTDSVEFIFIPKSSLEYYKIKYKNPVIVKIENN